MVSEAKVLNGNRFLVWICTVWVFLFVQAEEIRAKDGVIERQAEEIRAKDTHIRNLEYELNLIKGSRVWRLAELFRKVFYR